MSWNIQGLYEKHSFDDVKNLINQYDIIFISETWCHATQKVTASGYEVIDMPRQYNHPNAPHCFGGMVTLVKNHLLKGIQVVMKQCDHMCILKLDKHFFSVNNDYFIIGVYFNPFDSTYKCETCPGDYFAQLEAFISSHEDQGDFLIAGDLNAKTGLTPDFIENDILPFMPNLDDHCEAARHIFVPSVRNLNMPRFSEDSKCLNIHGRELLLLCKNTSIRMLNGRYGNDKSTGKCTCIKPNGKSLIDYILCSDGLLQNQFNFKIHSKQPESDHVPISVSLYVNNIVVDKPQEGDIYQCFRWDQTKIHNIKYTLSDLENPHLQKLLDSMVMNSGSDQVACCLDAYILDALQKNIKLKQSRNRNNFPANKWYDGDCKQARQAVKNLDTNTNDYLNAEREYKRIVQSKQRQHKCQVINSLNTEKDTSKTWKILHDLKPKEAKSPPIPPNSFKDHFDSISYDEPSFDKQFEVECLDFLDKFDPYEPTECDFTRELLDSHFTKNELDAVLTSLKDNKSCGIDGIPSEAFKYTQDVLGDTLLIILNYILDKGVYPAKWAEGLISPVHKAGAWNEPKNYRRITVQPAVSKIFDMLTNNRLVLITEILDKDDMYNGGFKKGSCTADNMFVLLSVIQRQKVLRKPLYIAFIDFKSAFDSVNRTLLFYKLIKSGYHGKIINILKDMYSKTKSKVKIKNHLSDFLNESHGVNQGGISSPFLFKAFLADFRQYLNAKCGVNMSNGEILTHILWADDLILLAESKGELQILLDNIFNYCKRWQLLVNLSKSKIMIINGKKNDNPIFLYNNIPLEIVHKYKYLGVIFSDSRNVFLHHITYTETIASRAIFSLNGYLYNLNQTPPPISMKLFDTLVQPIIEYASEIWSVCTSIDTLETLYLKFLKCTLGVRPQTPTAAIFGDIGRYPLHIRLQVKAVKYWCKLIRKPKGSLPHLAYQMLLSLRNYGFTTWLDSIFKILDNCDLSHYFENQNTITSQITHLITTNVKSKLQEQFVEKWHTEIFKLSKLRTFRLFKTDFESEIYLFLTNKKHRQALSQFRMSAHTLEIEKGRWSRKPIEERLCIFCNVSAIETEQHVLLSCSKYSEFRGILLNTAKDYIEDFENSSTDDQFIAILQSKEINLVQVLAKCIHSIFKTRIDVTKDVVNVNNSSIS
jgi:exonuclease III